MANEKRLIDANALQFKPEPIDNVMNGVLFIRGRGVGKTVAMVSDALKHMIDNAPTVDAVEVVHAKWENVQNGKGCCSNCHRLDGIDPLATYCRYCGAKMDGDGNG